MAKTTGVELTVMIISLMAVVIIGVAVGYLVTAGIWWTVLWSFGFPIAFAWKNVIGVMMLTLLFGTTSVIKGKK